MHNQLKFMSVLLWLLVDLLIYSMSSQADMHIQLYCIQLLFSYDQKENGDCFDIGNRKGQKILDSSEHHYSAFQYAD